jgi:hypothetical protein
MALHGANPPGPASLESSGEDASPPPLSRETRSPGRFQLRAGSQAAEPRRSSRGVSQELSVGSAQDELSEEAEASLPGYSTRYLDRRSDIAGDESSPGLPGGESPSWEEDEERIWGQFQPRATETPDPGSAEQHQTGCGWTTGMTP